MRNLVGGIGNGTLKSAGQINMEERPVHALHERNLRTTLVRLAVRDLAIELVLADDFGVLGRGLDAVGLARGGVRIGLKAGFDIRGLLGLIALVGDDFGVSRG